MCLLPTFQIPGDRIRSSESADRTSDDFQNQNETKLCFSLSFSIKSSSFIVSRPDPSGSADPTLKLSLFCNFCRKTTDRFGSAFDSWMEVLRQGLLSGSRVQSGDFHFTLITSSSMFLNFPCRYCHWRGKVSRNEIVSELQRSWTGKNEILRRERKKKWNFKRFDGGGPTKGRFDERTVRQRGRSARNLKKKLWSRTRKRKKNHKNEKKKSQKGRENMKKMRKIEKKSEND